MRPCTRSRLTRPMFRSADPNQRPTLDLRRYGTSPGSHAHAHYQVLWGWQGCLDLDLAGRSERVVPGSVTLIGPGERHDFQARQPASCLVLDTFDERLDALPRTRLSVPQAVQSRLAAWVQQATHPHAVPGRAANAPGGDGADPAWMAPMVITALLELHHAHTRRRPARQRPIDWRQLQAWINARLGHPVRVADLARQVALSPSQFAARCECETGLSPMAWLRRARLLQAAALRAQGLPVHQVAALCGYRSPSALTAAMRRDAAHLPPRARGALQ